MRVVGRLEVALSTAGRTTLINNIQCPTPAHKLPTGMFRRLVPRKYRYLIAKKEIYQDAKTFDLKFRA